MSKTVKVAIIAIVVIAGLLFAARNSESLKGYTGWMFEGKESEVALPDLSNEEIENAATAEESAATEGAATGAATATEAPAAKPAAE